MHVNATNLFLRQSLTTQDSGVQDKGPLFLAVVAMLASIALLTFLLRAYTRGVVLQDLGIDDWLISIPVLCVIGVLVIFYFLIKLGFGKHPRDIVPNTSSQISLYLWILNTVTPLGVGFVKLSVAFSVLRIIVRKCYRRVIYGIICLVIVITAEWIVSVMLQCSPLYTAWTLSKQPTAQCMSGSTYRSIGLLNASLNLATDFVFIFLALISFWIAHFSFNTWLSLVMVFCFASTTIVAAAIQIYYMYHRSGDYNIHDYNYNIHLWSAIDLTTGLTATCLYTLGSLTTSPRQSARNTHRSVNQITHPEPSEQPLYHPNFSNQTVIYRPNTAYMPARRFHDNVSNLDFDIETPATRTRTHTMRSMATRNTQSRPASTWSQFSGFTYYTNPAESTIELSHHRSRRVSTTELENIVQSLGLGRSDCNSPNIALAVRSLNGDHSHEFDDDRELVDRKSRGKR